MALLVTHIVVALAGIVQATYTLVRPSEAKLKLTHLLLAGTIATGTYLVWQQHAAIVSACISGLLYSAGILVATALARYRLAKVRVRSR